MFSFNHFNFNVTDLEQSLKFYKEALGLEPVRRKEPEDGSFILVYLGDGKSEFTLELTWLRDHPQKYDLGECEFHLAFQAADFEADLLARIRSDYKPAQNGEILFWFRRLFFTAVRPE